jgi:hypothetical protein
MITEPDLLFLYDILTSPSVKRVFLNNFYTGEIARLAYKREQLGQKLTEAESNLQNLIDAESDLQKPAGQKKLEKEKAKVDSMKRGIGSFEVKSTELVAKISDSELILTDLPIFQRKEVLEFLLTRFPLLQKSADLQFQSALFELLQAKIDKGELKVSIEEAFQESFSSKIQGSFLNIPEEEFQKLKEHKKSLQSIEGICGIGPDEALDTSLRKFADVLASDGQEAKSAVEQIFACGINPALFELWLQVKDKFIFDIEYLDLPLIKAAIEQMEHVSFFKNYTYEPAVAALSFIYNSAEKIVDIYREADYSSGDSLISSLIRLIGRDISDLDVFDIESPAELKFWQGANLESPKALGLFVSLQFIKGQKPDEYRSIIGNSGKDTATKLNELSALKEQIIEEALISAPEEKKPAIKDVIKQYGLSIKQVQKLVEVIHQAKTKDDLPDINFHFEHLGKKYTFHKLAADDLKGLFLGYESNSCQSIGKDGEVCAINGFTREDAGFYVLSQIDGEIIGQFYAWLAKDGLVLDSYEARPQGKKLFIPLLNGFRSGLNKDMKLYLGTGGGTPKLSSDTKPRPEALDEALTQYGDSNKVYVFEADTYIAPNDNDQVAKHVSLVKLMRLFEGLSEYGFGQGISIIERLLDFALAHPQVLENKILTMHLADLEYSGGAVSSVIKFLAKADDAEVDKFLEAFGGKDEAGITKVIQGTAFLLQDADLTRVIFEKPELVSRFSDCKQPNYEHERQLLNVAKLLLQEGREGLLEAYVSEEYGMTLFSRITLKPELLEIITKYEKILENPILIKHFSSIEYERGQVSSVIRFLTEADIEEGAKFLEVFRGKDEGGITKVIRGTALFLKDAELTKVIFKNPELVEKFSYYGQPSDERELQLVNLAKLLLQEGREDLLEAYVSEDEYGMTLFSSIICRRPEVLEIITKYEAVLENPILIAHLVGYLYPGNVKYLQLIEMLKADEAKFDQFLESCKDKSASELWGVIDSLTSSYGIEWPCVAGGGAAEAETSVADLGLSGDQPDHFNEAT